MDPEAQRPEDTAFTQPSTLHGSMPSMRLGVQAEEWALIRYIGQPIGEVISLDSEGITIGRTSECRVHLPEPEVSRCHARLDLVLTDIEATEIRLTDLGSTNGTYVNGHRLPSNTTVRLKDGDVVRVGSHAFKLKRLDGLEQHYHRTVLAQTTLDALTGVYNRASVLAYLEKHTDLARRCGRPFSLILCDLDHFKSINDSMGHATGDQVLRIFGLLTMGRLRASDMVGRIGGEEFLCVLPETTGPEAVKVAEQLRAAVANEPVISPGGGEPFHVSCCYGVAQLHESDTDGGALLARADVALYRAKSLGRNRVECEVIP